MLDVLGEEEEGKEETGFTLFASFFGITLIVVGFQDKILPFHATKLFKV